MRRKNLTLFNFEKISTAHVYSDAILSSVVTRSEASLIWDKELSTIDYNLGRNMLAWRKSLTDGAILITVKSLIARWGIPQDTILFRLYDGELTEEQLLALAGYVESEKGEG